MKHAVWSVLFSLYLLGVAGAVGAAEEALPLPAPSEQTSEEGSTSKDDGEC